MTDDLERRDGVIEILVRTIGLFSFLGGGSRLSPLGTSATNCPIVTAPDDDDDDDDECGAVCGMKFGRGYRSTRRKPATAPLCPPQIPHDVT
jgi:hypothetical protein